MSILEFHDQFTLLYFSITLGPFPIFPPGLFQLFHMNSFLLFCIRLCSSLSLYMVPRFLFITSYDYLALPGFHFEFRGNKLPRSKFEGPKRNFVKFVFSCLSPIFPPNISSHSYLEFWKA
ncbi:hypothetical protein ACH5RR_029352 [Cinchona calisaya]|uniref:Uncharacterized protein n=1 Tax=Cinchona calisaya TaxID=153742 RepID=A0ABD2YTP5_9GENT